MDAIGRRKIPLFCDIISKRRFKVIFDCNSFYISKEYDDHIRNICELDSTLNEKYDLLKNMEHEQKNILRD